MFLQGETPSRNTSYVGILADMERMGAFDPSSQERRATSIDHIIEPADARIVIHELFEYGERPVVSVLEQYADAAERGLTPHTTWIPGFSAIVGTFGREPYVPSGERRVLFRVNIESEDQIEPRFTGPSKEYQGVVVLKGPIPARCLSRLQ